MPSVWSKISEYWTWFLWGKTPYNQLSDRQKLEARRDLYFRLFIIGNLPLYATLYATFVLSMYPPTLLKEKVLDRMLPEGWKSFSGKFCFGLYACLHTITMGAASVYFVFPWYTFLFEFVYSFGSSFYTKN
ncbi:unnamed protein product [Caenorhabditis sp. 36 PRJEB53466]|nr:unnamed protein product [Caenorhabditis sp. 36 PRJEB53466]